MDEALASRVRQRAGHRCEYCHLPREFYAGPFEIEHVIPVQHGGRATLSNLAYACLYCNKYKGSNLSGIDYVTSRTRLVRLFNPRRHEWVAHFRRDAATILGRTAIGPVTVAVLAMNDPLRVALRQSLIEEGWLPEE
jgi:5-methylcytosine-specific restriction endonuclease McrA